MTRRWHAAGLLAMGLTLTSVAPASETESAKGLAVRFAPGGYVYALPVKEPGLGYRGAVPYHDVMVHGVAFVNDTPGVVTLEGATLEVLRGGGVVQSQAISVEDIERDLALIGQLRGLKIPAAMDVMFAAGELLEGVGVADGKSLQPGTAAVASQFYLSVRGQPDAIRVRVRGRDAAGAPVTGEGQIEVRRFQSRNTYGFPLEAGSWFVQAFPGVRGHHRWTMSTEFAVDIVALDDRGSVHDGEGTGFRAKRWEAFHGYGKQVLAAADGKVVKVVADVEFPLATWRQGDEESRTAYDRRAGAMQMQLFRAPDADPISVAAGNHIVIEHAGGEYSFYGHLAHGSLQVKVGDAVRRGQHIAGLGGTGERPYVHLHFQVNDRADGLFGHSLPVTFDDARPTHPEAELRPSIFEPGYFVRVETGAR